jgi:hypothetical protein
MGGGYAVEKGLGCDRDAFLHNVDNMWKNGV